MSTTTNKQALREQVIIDISKHPLIKQAYEVCQAIEKCGASLEITGAVTKASALMQGIANAMALLDKWQQESSTWQSVAEKQLAIATEMEAKLQAAEKRIAELEARTPYGYIRQCDGHIQISIGSEQPHNRSGGYATPWFAIYTAAGITVKGE